MTTGTEIERKFLLHGVPPALRLARRQAIRQGYVALDGGTEVRVRMGSDEPTLTVKSGRGEVRLEEEVRIDTRRALALWELTEGRQVVKTRRRMRVGGVVVEVDEYAGDLDGLVVAEVEFPDEDASRAFEAPEWFAHEVTDDDRYKNRSLAVDGMPAPDG